MYSTLGVVLGIGGACGRLNYKISVTIQIALLVEHPIIYYIVIKLPEKNPDRMKMIVRGFLTKTKH